MPVRALQRFFSARATVDRGDLILVAFSGGPDSTALLAGLREISARLGVRLHAAHFDHRLDPDSGRRAKRAAALSRRLEVPFTLGCRPPGPAVARGESPEEAARRQRYRFLEETRTALGARYVATAHHRDDQAETVLLRMLQGTGPAGLAAIAPRRGAIVRPLLSVPRTSLEAYVATRGLDPVSDPTNRDLTLRRNFVRHCLLPSLPDPKHTLHRDLASLAATGARAAARVEKLLATKLTPARTAAGGVSVDRRLLETLPPPLLAPALALLHRVVGAANPPGARPLAELSRQLGLSRRPGGRPNGRIGCDCGAGWRLVSRGERLVLQPAAGATNRRAPRFAYTLPVPGEVWLPEVGGKIALRARKVAPWMFARSRRRAALALSLAPGDILTVRNRRPGDRIRPFGCDYSRKLKDLMIDRKIPRRERDRLPLLCVGKRAEHIVWIPGITIDERCRVGTEADVWVAELEGREWKSR